MLLAALLAEIRVVDELLLVRGGLLLLLLLPPLLCPLGC